MPHPQRAIRTWRRRLLLFGITLGVLLAVTEVASVLVYWIATGNSFSYASIRQEQRARRGTVQIDNRGVPTIDELAPTAHPFLGYVASTRLNELNTPGMRGDIRVNAHGFLDAQTPIHKRGENHVIIGIVGGSVAREFCVFGGLDVLRTRLRAHPRFCGKEIVFVRLALPGHKQPQQLFTTMWVQSLGGEFDYLINIDGYNEVALAAARCYSTGVYPFFPFVWHFLAPAIPNRERLRLLGRIVVIEQERESAARSFLNLPTYYSATLQVIWALRDRRFARERAAAIRALTTFRPENQPFVVTGPGIEGFTDDNVSGRLADYWRDASIQLHRVCRANGTVYLHFLQPNQYVEGSKPMGPAERARAFSPELAESKWARQGYAHLKARGQELVRNEVDFHDLTMIFSGVREPIYTDTCCHFSDENAHAMMAKHIAGAVLSQVNRRMGAAIDGKRLVELIGPDEIVVDHPYEPTALRTTGRFADGSILHVEPAVLGTSYRSSDRNVVTVTADGLLSARQVGEAEVTVSNRGIEKVVRVRVSYPKVVSFGRGVVGTDRHTPVLAAVAAGSVGDEPLEYRITRAVGGAIGRLEFSTIAPATAGGFVVGDVLKIPVICSGRPEVGGVGTCAIRLPAAVQSSLRGRVIYCQAFLQDPGRPNGFSATNALRVSLQ